MSILYFSNLFPDANKEMAGEGMKTLLAKLLEGKGMVTIIDDNQHIIGSVISRQATEKIIIDDMIRRLKEIRT